MPDTPEEIARKKTNQQQADNIKAALQKSIMEEQEYIAKQKSLKQQNKAEQKQQSFNKTLHKSNEKAKKLTESGMEVYNEYQTGMMQILYSAKELYKLMNLVFHIRVLDPVWDSVSNQLIAPIEQNYLAKNQPPVVFDVEIDRDGKLKSQISHDGKQSSPEINANFNFLVGAWLKEQGYECGNDEAWKLNGETTLTQEKYNQLNQDPSKSLAAFLKDEFELKATPAPAAPRP